MVYAWAAFVIAVCLFHSYVCIKMMKNAHNYGEDIGLHDIKFRQGPLLQLQLFIYLLVFMQLQAFTFVVYVYKVTDYYKDELAYQNYYLKQSTTSGVVDATGEPVTYEKRDTM